MVEMEDRWLSITEMCTHLGVSNDTVYKWLDKYGMPAHWGTGVRRIFTEARELGLPEPKIEEIGMRLRFTIYLAKLHTITTKQDESQSGPESGPESETEKHIVQALSHQPLSRAEIAQALGHRQISGSIKRAIKELFEKGLIEYTIPDKPNSRLQKYRLTTEGQLTADGRTLEI